MKSLDPTWAPLPPRIPFVVRFLLNCARRTPNFRGKSRLIRAFVIPLLPGNSSEFVTTTATGAPIALRFREALGLEVLLTGAFEAAELRWVLGQCRGGCLFVDVGSNIGFFAVSVGFSARDVEVVCLEPFEENVSRLKSNLSRVDRLDATVFQAAAGAEEGSVLLTSPHGDDAAYVQVRSGGGEGSVPVHRLDELLGAERIDRVAVMKVDVEGMEIDVLRGAGGVLRGSSPALLVEARDAPALRALEGFLAGEGYERMDVADFMPWNHAFVRAQS